MLAELLQSCTSASLLAAIVGLLVLHLFCSSCNPQGKKREPPGPKPLPLLGNLLQVDLKRLDSSLLDLSKKYGPVFTVWLGLKRVVVLAGYRTVKQALVNNAEEFGDREVTPIFYDFNKGHGILFSNGDSWKEMRRFALTTLRDFGMGKRISEGKIIEECRFLIEEFEQYEGKAFDNTQAICYATSNIISAIMFGKRFEYKDPVFQAMVERDHESIRLTGSAPILIYNMFPWLGPFLKNWRDLMKNVEADKQDTQSIIADLKETLNPDMCRCFVDAFLTRKRNLEESQIKDSHYHDDNLIYSVINLFAAGTDTTGNTLQWCLLFMAKYPHIQDQVQEELSRVVGSRQVRVEDRKNLPYTDAVIHETQRLANIVPMAIPHKTSRDVTFQGYFIKEGTTVFPLLTSVLYDEGEWESPLTFNPSHFLDKDGTFMRRDAFMPFSAGRRMCPGEGLAKMELFLFFTSLLQRFRFTPPPGATEDELDLTPMVGFTLTPSPHELCALSHRCGALVHNSTSGKFTLLIATCNYLVKSHSGTVSGAVWCNVLGGFCSFNRRQLPGDSEIMLEDLFQSSASASLLAAFVVLLVLHFYSSFSSPDDREPPGPAPLPLLGNLLQLDLKRPHMTLLELSKKYGSVFTVYFGPKKVVILAGYKTVKQALVHHAVEFGEREIFPIANELNGSYKDKGGILFANGESWKEMRRFALSTLRDFGMGKKAAEEKIIEETQYLIKEFEKHEGKPFVATKLVNNAVSNIICSIVYGSRFNYSDPEFTSMVSRANENVRLSGSPSIQLYNVFPWMGKLASNRTLLKRNVAGNRGQIQQLIKRLQETLNTQMCRGFVDSFLAHRQKLEDSGNANPYYSDENLVSTVGNLFVAGTDTTATTLRWGLLLMAKYPQIQHQVQEELSMVVGSRQVRVEDRKNLPFADAVIHEIQRLANILPISLPHVTSTDVTFQGYFIKKGTTVYPLLASVLWDESEWESPRTFNPAHFLDKDGKFVKRDAFMPFSAGRRVCLGESLAKMELFLFFTTLLQRFRFTPPPGVSEDELDLTPAVGFTINPSPHELCAVSREEF
ncbi:uncharacterized protein [Pempheris klunzingeri]|uniref:uncharacterized protein n=1 Tax=Pempheris klunzingeri TaxID=3127111 RepID=UPI00397FB3E6